MQVHEKFKTTITSAGKAPYRAYRQNPANGTAAHLYAFSLAKKYNKTVYVYTGNSYGSRVYRVTFDKMKHTKRTMSLCMHLRQKTRALPHVWSLMD